MPKFKTHKGLQKRIRVTATGKVKFRGANNGHLRSKKTGKKIRQLRRKRLMKLGDKRRLEKILHRHLTPV